MEALAIQSEYIDQREHQRRADLETQFAELIDGTMRTDFDLHFRGGDLISDDGRSMDAMTNDALDAARQNIRVNPSLWFEVRRRSHEREEFTELLEMARGDGPNTMVVVSDFPAELVNASRDVGGYNVARKQTMLRVLTRSNGGTVHMSSQSLDGSNRLALEAIYERFGVRPEANELLGQRIRVNLSVARQEFLTEQLKGVYDRSLSDQYGGQWRAGRPLSDSRNTYDFVRQQRDLISECLRLDSLGWLNEKVLYDISATMSKRFKDLKVGPVYMLPRLSIIDPSVLRNEIELAGATSRQKGETFSACGVTLGASSIGGDQLSQAGYGGEKSDDSDCTFESKECPFCHQKKVRTVVHRIGGGKKRISGSCGCVKIAA